MTVTGFIAYAQGWGGLYIRANRLAWKQMHRNHPGLGIAEPVRNIPGLSRSACTGSTTSPLAVGAPAAYDYGPERCSWMTHHLTDWMGDAGFLTRSRSRIRRHNPVGDVLYFTGEVTGKRQEADGRALVDIEQRAVNQDGELSIEGSATVELPTKQNR